MGIAKLKPEADPNLRIHTTEVPRESYKGIVADNSNTPAVTLQAYIDGMPWVVSYFKQLLGEHNDLRPLDTGGHAAAQQYEKYGEMELKVATALTPSYDSETAKSTVTGSAVIPVITPNIHDYFISDAGSRQYGIYRVTNVERRTFNRDSVYLIDYQLVCYASSENDAYIALENRTIRRFRFSKQRLVEGLSPILRLEEFELLSDFHRYYGEIVSEYMRDFFNRTYMTLVVPGQTSPVYDVWMADFLYSLMDPEDHPDVRKAYRPLPYIGSEIADIYAASTIIAGRAGAGAIWEAASLGKPMILIPLSGSGTRGDQVENAAIAARSGIATVLQGPNIPSDLFADAVKKYLDFENYAMAEEACHSFVRIANTPYIAEVSDTLSQNPMFSAEYIARLLLKKIAEGAKDSA